jgi:L,D-transpeptidase-like protein
MARGVVVPVVLALAPLLGAFGASTAAAAVATGEHPAAAATLVSATPCAVTAKACMDLSSHQAWLTDGAGHVINGPVAARGGTKSAPTPVGTFHVLAKDKNFYSTEFHAPMPYSVFFYPGDAFHADNTSIASNGCIHLTSSSAQRFYNTLHLGDQVQIVS